MIGLNFRRKSAPEGEEAKGFDAYDLRLGDLMRGERATMGKSLLDVQRELKIKAAYIAAIENADPSAFETPGFIAGYVRSYARYLNMDGDWAYETFCKESGFTTAHGMSAAASSPKAAKPVFEDKQPTKDIFASPRTPFVPAGESMFANIEPGAVGSVMVLAALICGLGFGGWTVLQEVQKVRFAPVENTPIVTADLDPLAGVGVIGDDAGATTAVFEAPAVDGLDRLYRPQALDVPVMIARDGPISSLNPSSIGVLAPEIVEETVVADAGAAIETPLQGTVQVTEGPAPELAMVAVRPAWVRVRASDGSVLFEGIMNAGDTWTVPSTEEPPTLRVGESGAVYFQINGTPYGPVGERGVVTSNLALSADTLSEAYSVADLSYDEDLARVVNVAEVQQ
ncbi:helix-turn-helix domain-containing protein [Marivivens niveibacter]|uniref:Helix-turn-helix domain-containing protein n=1 Tax=Marivivens niveibacter TaxID=1930667 RepID=A0A251WWA5_9RHOB|nr:helix-turn-helix domain-containing protein [Marivivens niveibacter]OUD08652.1 helix-turn-helix domain-containing protein [Marivivens niveibacter]